VAAWREAYRAFGAKPQRTRNSLEALLRRAASGLPRVNRLTDRYNAVSVLHQIPLGGEDLTRYAGPPRLIRAAGDEPFDTVADGIAGQGGDPHRQLADFQPERRHAAVAPGAAPYGRMLPGIRGVRLAVLRVDAKFKIRRRQPRRSPPARHRPPRAAQPRA
jgi:hypothetical protein